MNPKLSLSIILTIGAFVLTLYLFVVVEIAHDAMAPEEYLRCGTVDTTPMRAELELDHPGAKIFAANCKACHRINQKLVGPALAGVMDRYDSLWLTNWIRNSSKMIAEGDPMAVALFREYNQIQMTSFTGFSDKEMKDLLEYLRLASEVKSETVPASAPGRVGV